MKSSIFWIRSILLILLILPVNKVFSQSKFTLSGGLGMPELFNVRLKYGQKIQIGACIGLATGELFGQTFVDWSLAAEVTYHFLGKSKYVQEAPWYILGGLGCYHLPILGDYEAYNAAFYPRIGRTINFSKRIGITGDFGVFLPLSANNYKTYNFKILPCGSISFFIRLEWSTLQVPIASKPARLDHIHPVYLRL